MCAQFPMLSAPSPPEGASPTPTPPTLPFSNIGSPEFGDLSRTAPPDVYDVSNCVCTLCVSVYVCVYMYMYACA